MSPNSPASQPATWAKVVGCFFLFLASSLGFEKLLFQANQSRTDSFRFFLPSIARRSRCFAATRVTRESKIYGLVLLFPNRKTFHANRPFRCSNQNGFFDKVDTFFIHHDLVTRWKVHKPVVNPRAKHGCEHLRCLSLRRTGQNHHCRLRLGNHIHQGSHCHATESLLGMRHVKPTKTCEAIAWIQDEIPIFLRASSESGSTAISRPIASENFYGLNPWYKNYGM